MIIQEFFSAILFYLVFPFYLLERIIHKKTKGTIKKFGFCDSVSGKVIMIHGCSVGEINAVGTLVGRIKNEFPEYKIVLTTSTITGQDVAHKKYSNIADYITYFPFDNIFEVNRFLKRINPTAVFIAETEIWPSFALNCKKKNIPLYIINGRISDKSFKQYKLFKHYFKKVFQNYTSIYTQTNDDTRRFIEIGAKEEQVKLMGNIKFDIDKQDVDIDIGQNGYKVIIAGSTHGIENKILISTYAKLKENFNNLKLVIAPRHLKNIGKIEELCSKFGLKFGHRSSSDRFSDSTDVIIIDTLGELSKMYSICDIAYIGGSLVKVGGHNPLEACIYNKPVISGNYVSNFKDIYSILMNTGAAKIIKNDKELLTVFTDILDNEELYNSMSQACKTAFEQQKNAVDFVINVIRESV